MGWNQQQALYFLVRRAPATQKPAISTPSLLFLSVAPLLLPVVGSLNYGCSVRINIRFQQYEGRLRHHSMRV